MNASIELILTNDWELFGEGQGDFYSLQQMRLRELLATVEAQGAKLTIFAEVGQQFAHIQYGHSQPRLQQIAHDWESSIAEAIQRGHDVQLHYHPTWNQAKYINDAWQLNLKNWALTDLDQEEIDRILIQSKKYLEKILQKVRPDYRCVSFRAGAFAIQPEHITIPALIRTGLVSDSSILPGYWDYLHIDFRGLPESFGPFMQNGIWEFPVHTQRVWDAPVLRKLIPAFIKTPLRYGIRYDQEFETWKIERDRVLHSLCSQLDPLHEKRQRVRLSPRRWLTYLFRKSAIVLDYDFISPGLFVHLLEIVLVTANKNKIDVPIPIVALGHTNNSQNPLNLERCLRLAKKSLGKNLVFSTMQEAVEKRC